jgi:branched-chain amino acid transport system substrate-binding protein
MSRRAVLSSFVLRHSSFTTIWLLAIGSRLSAAEPAGTNTSSPPPFLRFREATLSYTGPESEFTNLTEIRIGWFGPTNLNDPLTGDLWWSANLAIQEADTRGSALGLRPSDFRHLPFRLVPRWAVDPWGTGISQLTRMVYDEQPLALLGSVDSASTHLAEQVVAKANLPLVSPIATDKSVTLAGVSWMFACAPSDDAIARLLVDAVLAALKGPADKLVLLTVTDHASRMMSREVLREFAQRGRRPDFRFDVPPGAADTARQMQATAEAKPTVVLILAGTEDAARLVRSVHEKLGAVAIFGSQSMSRARFPELAGPAAEGVRFPLLFLPSPADTNAQHFSAHFSTERHHPPDYAAALTYDATRLLIEAIRRAGPNRARIRESLIQLSPWQGIAGRIEWDGTGQNMRRVSRMGIITNGLIVPQALP